MTNKDRMAELVGRVRDQAKLQEPIASSIVEIVRLSIEGAKESLVNAEGNDIHRLQGAARHLTNLYKDLTTEPPQITKGS